jgi:hypothetical protein
MHAILKTLCEKFSNQYSEKELTDALSKAGTSVDKLKDSDINNDFISFLTQYLPAKLATKSGKQKLDSKIQTLTEQRLESVRSLEEYMSGAERIINEYLVKIASNVFPDVVLSGSIEEQTQTLESKIDSQIEELRSRKSPADKLNEMRNLLGLA